MKKERKSNERKNMHKERFCMLDLWRHLDLNLYDKNDAMLNCELV